MANIDYQELAEAQRFMQGMAGDRINNDMTLAKLREWNDRKALRDQQAQFNTQDLQSKLQLLPVQTQHDLMKAQYGIDSMPQEQQVNQMGNQAKVMQYDDLIKNFPNDANLKRLVMQSQIAKNLGGGKVNQQNVRLGVDERLNPDGTVSMVPGSKTYRQQSSIHGKDYASLLEAGNNADTANSKIKYILDEKNKDAFNSMFGGYNAKFLTQHFPGETQNMRAKLDSLKSDLKIAGLNRIRAGGAVGQMTEREWPIVQDLIDKLDPTMSEEQARTVLGEINNRLTGAYNRAKDAYSTEWGNSEFYKPVVQPAQGNPNIEELLKKYGG